MVLKEEFAAVSPYGKNLTLDAAPQAFAAFKKRFRKRYSSKDEEQRRFRVFHDNLHFIVEHNSQVKGLRLGITRFMDLQLEEFRSGYAGGLHPLQETATLHLDTHRQRLSKDSLPNAVDWSGSSVVSPVKDQGHCNSCWAFSAAGAIESMWAIRNKVDAVSLSEQQFVDCDPVDGGCDGGFYDNAFRSAEGNHPLCTEDSYPYVGSKGMCRVPETGKTNSANCTTGVPQGGVIGFRKVAKGDDVALMDALVQQPVSAAIRADGRAFQHYVSGIMPASNCGKHVDHGILLVGFGEDQSGAKYWKVKNSWGTDWGMQGYVLLSRGVGLDDCGILAVSPSYPVVCPDPPCKAAGDSNWIFWVAVVAGAVLLIGVGIALVLCTRRRRNLGSARESLVQGASLSLQENGRGQNS